MKGIEGFTLGRYELRRRIAQGGMSEVYLAYDRRVRRQVAIKVLYGRDVSFVRRFEREALAVGALSHNHILPLYDFGEQTPWYYLVMPYVEGGTLRDYLLKRKQLPLEEAASFVDQIAAALQYAHDSKVVHRDVKPSNILLRSDGYAYLVDFGLAKALMGAESLTSDGAMVGTPEYMAPEQSNGESDYRSDIYSLGVILYQMLTGRVPFMAESPVAISLKHIQSAPIAPSELNSEIPPMIEEVILKAMAKDPAERYQQAQELSNAYWKALQQERARLQSETAASDTHENSSQEPSEAAVRLATAAQLKTAAITRVLEETRLRPPIVPLVVPLTEQNKAVPRLPRTGIHLAAPRAAANSTGFTTDPPPEIAFSSRASRHLLHGRPAAGPPARPARKAEPARLSHAAHPARPDRHQHSPTLANRHRASPGHPAGSAGSPGARPGHRRYHHLHRRGPGPLRRRHDHPRRRLDRRRLPVLLLARRLPRAHLHPARSRLVLFQPAIIPQRRHHRPGAPAPRRHLRPHLPSQPPHAPVLRPRTQPLRPVPLRPRHRQRPPQLAHPHRLDPFQRHCERVQRN